MKKISVVLPCLNEARNLPIIVPEIIKQIPSRYQYEIICVDDGSIDRTRDVLQRLGSENQRIKSVILHKRSGHQSALMAGIQKASGDAVITMDADLQHPPDLIPVLISHWEKGHDLVLPQKKLDNTRNPLYKVGRRMSYKLWSIVSEGVLIPGVSDFRLMDKKIVSFILNSLEGEIFIRGLVSLMANSAVLVPYQVRERAYGKSGYSFTQLVGVFITGFVSFSTKPLKLASFIGLLIALATSLFLLFDILGALIHGKSIIAGWLTLVMLILVLNGFTIFYIGIIGEYIGVIFKEVKKRPKYLIEETINF